MADRLLENVENSIILNRKLSEEVSDLTHKLVRLSDEMDTLKRQATKNVGNDQTSQTSQIKSVFFSVATAKRIHCYNCVINFELVNINNLT